MKIKLLLIFILVTGSLLAKPIQYRDISYLPASYPGYDRINHKLDIYLPEHINEKTEVVVFIHGGKWRLGSKNVYRFLGKKLAKHNVVTVIINYRLSPDAKDYSVMAMDCAHAVKWVYNHIEEYHGDKNRIFLYGHSSGAHLAALITLNHRFLDSTGVRVPIKGCVLFDPFGLNIDTYLEHPQKKDKWMYDIFTKDSKIWKDATPVNFIKGDTTKYLIYIGDNSPAKIQNDAHLFFEAVGAETNNTIRLTKLYNAGHLTIIFQFYNTRNRLYKELVKFMK